jgi:enoyl-CoA hydratase
MTISIEKNGPVTTVILDRPDVRNAVDRPTAEALAAAFRAFDKDEKARVGVLWGKHGAFCAGADLKAVAEGPGSDRINRLEVDGDAPMGVSRLHLSKPVIAAISGHAVAGGLEVALWCDLRVAEEDAQLGVFCRRWGVPLIDGGTVRLPRIVGMSRALDLVLTGRAVATDEALTMGLINRVVPIGTAREAAEELALELSRLPQTCMLSDRASVYEQQGRSLEDAMTIEFGLGKKALETEAVGGAQRFAAGAGRHGQKAT